MGTADIETWVDRAYARRRDVWEQALEVATGWLTLECDRLMEGGDRTRLDCSQSRIKDQDRTVDKLLRRVDRKPIRISSVRGVEKQITDLVGIKVLCKSTRDQSALFAALSSIPTAGPRGQAPAPDSTSTAPVRLLEVRDYITEPKPSGYRACHVLISVPVEGAAPVTVEIQIKTRLQDAWGELTHEDLYKPGAAMSPGRFHGSVARAMSALLAEVDLLADDLAEELETVAVAAGENVPDDDDVIRVRVRSTGPKYALAVDGRGQQGLIPARAVRALLGSKEFIRVDKYLPEGRRLNVRIQHRDGGVFYLPVDLGDSPIPQEPVAQLEPAEPPPERDGNGRERRENPVPGRAGA